MEKQSLEELLAEVKWQHEFFATPKGKLVKEKLDASANIESAFICGSTLRLCG
jgi:hypothetical protein